MAYFSSHPDARFVLALGGVAVLVARTPARRKQNPPGAPASS